MNGVNLDQFQFEYDLTWMAFFQNSLGHNYARYGGRDDADAESYLTKASLVSTMNKVLELHKTNQVKAESKYEPRPSTTFTPEEIPLLKRSLEQRKDGCIHCHDVKNFRLRELARLGELEKKMVFTYPSPSQIGFELDADRQNMIKRVIDGSAAKRAGINSGDEIIEFDQQPVMTFADMTRILELSPEEGEIEVKFLREAETFIKSLPLEAGWKQAADPSWRASTDVVGPNSGFWGPKLDVSQKEELGINPEDLAVKANFIWGDWAKKAGIKQGDVVVSINGKKNDMTIRQLQAYLQMNLNYGDSIPIEVLRDHKKIEMTMRLPASRNN